MLASTFTCPRCRRTLQTPTPLPAGQQVLCSACGSCFTAGPQTASPAPVSAPTPPPNAGGLPSWLQPVPTRPAPTATRTTPPPPLPPTPPAQSAPPGRNPVLLAAVVGGLPFLAGASVLAFRLATRNDQRQQAAGNPPGPAETHRAPTPPPQPTPDPSR